MTEDGTDTGCKGTPDR